MKIGNFNLETDGTYIIAELSANHKLIYSRIRI
jgi:sialic acid synthase SpsE